SANRELHWHIHRHVNPQLGNDAMLSVLENGVTKTVPNDISAGAAGRPRGGRPDLAGFFIPNVKGLAGEVAHRIVKPRGEPEFVCVFKPGVSTTIFRNDRAERWIGQHIDPARGCDLPGMQGDDVFVAIRGETAEPVVKNEITPRRLRGRLNPRGAAGIECGDGRLKHAAV